MNNIDVRPRDRILLWDMSSWGENLKKSIDFEDLFKGDLFRRLGIIDSSIYVKVRTDSVQNAFNLEFFTNHLLDGLERVIPMKQSDIWYAEDQ